MKTILVFLLCSFLIIPVLSQDLDLGAKIGANIGTPYMKPEKGATGSLGIGPLLGVFSKYYLNDRLAVHFEVLYSQKGAKFDTPVEGDTLVTQYVDPNDSSKYMEKSLKYHGRVNGSYNNQYIDLPIFLSYRYSKRFSAMIGLQFSYLIKGENKGTADILVGDPEAPFIPINDVDFDQSHELNRWDYSILIGTQYEGKKLFNLGISLTTGLGSIYKQNYKYLDKVVRNIYLQAYLGFKIKGKRY